jgi:uncharacterized protein YdaU (DUF1376 family)
MAKDPAFLFYPGDWQGGTMYMSHQVKGAYMDLMILQFNVGKFTLAQAEQVLSICFDVAWPMLKQKFVTDGEFFWNERLALEIEKRKKFTKSRRDNALGGKEGTKKSKASAEHMLQHMENENINEDEIKEERIEGIREEGEKLPVGIFPGPDEATIFELPMNQVEMAIQLIKVTKKVDVTEADIRQLFNIFKFQHFNGKKHYRNESATHAHFLQSLKYQSFQYGQRTTPAGSGRNAGATELAQSYAAGIGYKNGFNGSTNP